MMASPVISNPVTTSVRQPKRSKKKLQAAAQAGSGSAQWKSEALHRAYSSKLIHALRQLRLGSSGQAVRKAADRALAVTAKGRTRWSRAILTNRLKLKLFSKSKRRRVPTPGSSRANKPRVSILRLKAKNLPAVQRKARVLGRLVPGCRKEALPVILEETTDYVAALQMQVKAMSDLAELLSGSNSTSSAHNS